MKRLVFAAALTMALIIGASSPYEADPYFILCGEADSAIARADYPTAVRRLKEAMSIRPDAPENILLLNNLGNVYSYMDEDTAALQTLEEALRRAPAMRTVRRSYLRLLLKIGRDFDAYRQLDTLIAADSLDTDSRYLHGLLAAGRGDTCTAAGDFSVLAALKPDDISTAIALSTLNTMLHRPQQALPYLRRLAQLQPDPDSYASLAECLIDLERYSEARETIAEGLQRYPESADLYEARARLNTAEYRLDEARADQKRARKLQK